MLPPCCNNIKKFSENKVSQPPLKNLPISGKMSKDLAFLNLTS